MINAGAGVTRKGLRMAHLNVRSLMGGHKFDMLKQQIYTGEADVFMLSETWLTSTIPDKLIEIPRYSLTGLDRAWNSKANAHGDNLTPKRVGGLAIYVSSQIKYSDTKFSHLNRSGPDLEMQWVSLLLEHVRPIVVINIYRPPQGNYKEACRLILEAFDRADMKDNTEIYVMGDFNINYKDSKSPEFKELDFSMRALGLNQLLREVTRVSFRNGVDSSTILDLVFTNSDIISKVQTFDLNISDHLAVMVTRKKIGLHPSKLNLKVVPTKIMLERIFKSNYLTETGDNFLRLMIRIYFGD